MHVSIYILTANALLLARSVL